MCKQIPQKTRVAILIADKIDYETNKMLLEVKQSQKKEEDKRGKKKIKVPICLSGMSRKFVRMPRILAGNALRKDYRYNRTVCDSKT